MDREVMKHQILEALSKKLGDGFHLSIQKVLKTNTELDGLKILKDGEDIFPTIYLEPVYEALEDGTSTNTVASNILREYHSARSQMEDFDISPLRNFNYVKDRLYVQLINRHLNKNLLRDVPHIMFLDDFAITVRCRVESPENYNASFLVHNNYANIWQTDINAVLSRALRNMRTEHDVELMSLEQQLKGFVPFTDDHIPSYKLWVMTNKDRNLGAATVLLDDVLEDFSQKYGSFYVIFSSVHEALLIPSPDNSDIDILSIHNRNINESSLEKHEVLGTKAYFYQKGSGFVL